MCFSAEASFGASAIVLTIGLIAIKKSTTVPQRILSCIPLIFSAQQFTEGILWLSLSHPGLSHWNNIATYAFLIFAQVVWPIVVPLSVMLMEKETNNKKVLIGLLVLGIIVSSYLSWCLLFYKVHASVSCNHIRYDVDYPIFKHSGIIYFMAAALPPIISSIKRLRLFGIIIILSYVVTKVFYEYYLVSVWCFFAAFVSIIILSVIIEFNKPTKQIAGILPV